MAGSPSFQFYPGDWLRNNVSGCSLEAQGLWLRMMIVMHDSDSYGQLALKNEPLSEKIVAQKCGISLKKYRHILKELDVAGVINRKENGVIFSGRMERDEAKRQQNAARQRDFYERHKDEPNAKPNADLTPSSQKPNTSLHSSSSNKKRNIKEKRTRPDLHSEEDYLVWLEPQYRNGLVRQKYKLLLDWCEKKNEKPTRKRLLNWLDKDSDDVVIQMPTEGCAVCRDPKNRRGLPDTLVGVISVRDATGYHRQVCECKAKRAANG